MKMPKRIEGPVVARHIELYEADWQFINESFGRSSPYRVGAARVVREIVHARVKALREARSRRIDELSPAERLLVPRALDGLAHEATAERDHETRDLFDDQEDDR